MFSSNTLKLGPIGTFDLHDCIGRSSYGEIWQATWRETGLPAAVKQVNREQMCRAPVAMQNLWVEALERERRLLVSVQARSIVHCMHTGQHEGLPVLVLEHLAESLSHAVGRRPLGLKTSLEYLRQAADGLRSIHRAGWRHSDLKPSNLLLTPPNELGQRMKIADFGCCMPINQLEQHNTGTLGWQAPEQFFPVSRQNGRFLYRVDARADFYSLGQVFFFMLTGKSTRFGLISRDLGKRDGEQAAWAARGQFSGGLEVADRDDFKEALSQHREISAHSEKLHLQAMALLEKLISPIPTNRPSCATELLKLIEQTISD